MRLRCQKFEAFATVKAASASRRRAGGGRCWRPLWNSVVVVRVPLPTALLRLPALDLRLPPRVFSTAVCAIRALFHCYVRNAGV